MNIGKHRAKVISHVFGRSPKKGTPGIDVNFQILSGDSEGETIRWTGYLTGKTAERTITALRTCGWVGKDLRRLTVDGFGSEEVEIVIGIEENRENGKSYFRVQWVNPLSNLEVLDDAAIAGLNEEWAHLIDPEAVQRDAFGRDDIPF